MNHSEKVSCSDYNGIVTVLFVFAKSIAFCRCLFSSCSLHSVSNEKG